MHTLNSDKFIGNIEKIETINNSIRITGWVVDKTLAPIAANDIVVCNANKPIIIESGIFFKERLDVFRYFNGTNRVYLNSGFEIMLPVQEEPYNIVVKGHGVITLDPEQSTLSLEKAIQQNTNSKLNLIVVDNFYKDPDRVRAFALQQDFKHNEQFHKGARTEKSFIPSWVSNEFKRLLHKQSIEFVGASGVFQYCTAKDNVVYHYDFQEYAAMVYLTPDAPLQTGTRTYRSKRTGLYEAASDEDVKRLGRSKEELDHLSFNGSNFYDKHNLEMVDSVANVYNRLVIFNARLLHAATSYFGDNKENSRLFHLYFFNCK